MNHYRERHVPISEGFCPDCLTGLVPVPRLTDSEIRGRCPACGTLWAINRRKIDDELPGWCCTTHRATAKQAFPA